MAASLYRGERNGFLKVEMLLKGWFGQGSGNHFPIAKALCAGRYVRFY